MQRTKTLTTKHVKAHKTGLLVLFFAGILVIIFAFFNDKMSTMMFVLIPSMFYSVYINIRNTKRIRQVEYDDSNLYAWHNEYQIQIPFEEIREVKIESAGYLFKLYKKTQVGKEILCLPSLLYPLNYKKVDGQMNRVREMIAKRKREVSRELVDSTNQLNSVNL
ncbi:MAG: hypothetical protein ACJA2S_002847 [Cyclobacteriaceae bacterium]|jgi:hypothetical protein